jgi:L-cysteine desulfidase
MEDEMGRELDILMSILRKEVFPALGCTEPIALALACARATKAIKEATEDDNVQVNNIVVRVDPGTMKNGIGVTIPNTNGLKGLKIAAALGAVGGDFDKNFEVLSDVTPENLQNAEDLVNSNSVIINVNKEKTELFIEVTVFTEKNKAMVRIELGHSNIVFVSVNDEVIIDESTVISSVVSPELDILSKMTFLEMAELVSQIDDETREFIESGISMNLEAAKAGLKLDSFAAYQLGGETDIKKVSSSADLASLATDARMGGVSLPIMSSGGSGNQGTVSILVPYWEGSNKDISHARIIESIVLSHLVNSYTKVFLGQLSSMCGCAVGAAIGAAAAIAYQHDKTFKSVAPAINNVVATISGMICDGANSGCVWKVRVAAGVAVEAVSYALGGHCASSGDGIIGSTAEKTIQNLGKISEVGMLGVDNVILDIVQENEKGGK